MNPQDQGKTPEVLPSGTAVVPAAQSAPAVQSPSLPELANKTWFRGVPPEDKLNRMYGFAMAIKDAAFISPVVRGDAASVFYMVSMGEDLGLQWTHATRSIYPMVRKGRDGDGDQIRAGIQGDIALALLQARKFKIRFLESNDEIATVWMQRPDETMEFQDSFTILEAQRLELLKKPNWQYRRDMLRWRAVMRVARIVAADVLGGMYLPDEIDGDGFGVSSPSEPRLPAPNPFQVAAKPAADKTQADGTRPAANAEAGSSVSERSEGTGGSIHASQSGKDREPHATSSKGETGGEPSTAAAEASARTAAPAPEATGKATGSPAPESSPSMDKPQDAPKVAEAPAPQPTPINTPKAAPSIANQYLTELAAILPANAADKTTKEFLRGFLQTKFTMKDPKVPEALGVMVAIAKAYAAQLLQDPYGSGVQAIAGWKGLQKFIDKWPEDSKTLARQIGLERYADTGGGDLIEYLQDPIHVETMSEHELLAFLMVLARFPAAIATAVRESPKGVLEIVSGLDMRECTEGELLARLSGTEPTTAQIAAVQEEGNAEEVQDLFAMIRGEKQ